MSLHLRHLTSSRRALVMLSIATVLAAGGPGVTDATAQPAVPDPIVVSAPGDTMELGLRDGSRFYGQVTSVSDAVIGFHTVGGATVTVSRADIVLLRRAEGRTDARDESFPADPNTTRLFFGPTGRGLPAGSGYVGVYELFMPFVQVGVTDRLSLGGGTPLFFGGDSTHPFWFTPKLQVYSGKAADASVGVMHITTFGDEDGGGLGVAYGVTTFGTPDASLTIGAGWGYTYDEGDEGGAAIGMIGGDYRVSRRLKLMTENYVFENGALLSVGVRFIGDRLSADLALAMPAGADETFVFPMVNFMWTFGSR